eukprot:m.205116 g.205116  ORF g.205116 m.205116 type:complete len:58 (+) comp17092_c1_seq5:3785-3958(+)
MDNNQYYIIIEVDSTYTSPYFSNDFSCVCDPLNPGRPGKLIFADVIVEKDGRAVVYS